MNIFASCFERKKGTQTNLTCEPKLPTCLHIPLGVLADKFGRLVVCVALVSVYVAAGVGGGLTTSLPVWLILRFVLGAANIGMNTVRYTLQACSAPYHHMHCTFRARYNKENIFYCALNQQLDRYRINGIPTYIWYRTIHVR